MSYSTDTELEMFCQRHGIFLYAIAFKDQLAEVPIPRHGGIVINMDDTHGVGGTHWVALQINGKSVAYFDSFGLPPPRQVEQYIGRITDSYIRSDKQIQNIRSGWCGYYCCVWLYHMQHSRGTMRQRYNSFERIWG